MDINKRLKKLLKSVENTKTEARFKSNKTIVDRLMKYLRESKDDAEFYNKVIPDYPVFCAMFIDGKDEPFIPAPWQIRAARLFLNKNRLFFFNCRRSGKSSWAASIIAWDMCRRQNAKHLIFAPTKQQLIVMEEVYKVINGSDFIVENFVKGNRRLETNRHQKIEFHINGSSVEAFNIGVQGQGKKGDYLRGMGGNVVWIDEIGLVDADTREEVINPIIRDAYGDEEKKMVFFGTPKLAYNPDLEIEWEQKQGLDYWGTMQVTCWDALNEGIRTPQMMREIFNDDLRIPCKHVCEHGVCPEFAPQMLDGVPEGWECDQNYICMDNDKFVMEDLAGFPRSSDKFFPKEWLMDAKKRYEWYNPTHITPEQRFVMAIDLGLLQDPTAVLIGHITKDEMGREILRYAAYRSINPWEEGETLDDATKRHVQEMKRIYHLFKPEKVYVDVTKGTDYASRLYEGEDAIPRARIYANEAMEKKGGVGCWWDGHFKSKIYLNHKDLLQQRRIQVPDDKVFFEQFFQNHYQIKAEPAHGGQYLTFGKKSYHLLDAAVMLSWHLSNDREVKRAMTFMFLPD